MAASSFSSFSSSSSSSSSSSRKGHHVFPSFHGPDVRRGFLSHLHNIFAKKEIPMFKDQEIERGHTIGSELVQGIREARASIVVLSTNYASSVWCLDELLEILKCKEASGQIVMPIFYDVDPSDVRKQKGDFGIAFEKTYESETEEKKQRWIEALACVATIAGEHTRNWTDESAMVEKISTDVMKQLLKKEFMAQDADHNGFITAPELRYYLTKDGDNVVTDEEVSALILMADVDGDGRISFDEFAKLMMAKNDETAIEKIVTDARKKQIVEELKKEFMSLDVDNNGFITAPELRYFLTKTGDKVVTDEEVSAFIRAADVDGDGRISYDEFIELMTLMAMVDSAVTEDEEAAMAKMFATDVKLSSEEKKEMMELFMALDVDKSGFITAEEYQYLMRKAGNKATDEGARDFIRAYDVDGDGRVSYDEFVKLMMAAKIRAARVEKFATDVSKKVNKFVKFMIKAFT